jgi:LysM repeat protein
VWRSLVAAVAMTVASVGAAVPGANTAIHLDIETRTGTASSVLVFSSATLDCDGKASATGFLRDVAPAACAAARGHALARVMQRQRTARICVEDYRGPQLARVTGGFEGRRVKLVVSQADGCGAADWEELRPLLGDPERLGRMRARAGTATTTTTAPPVLYQVRRGDTLTGIARRFRTTVSQITNLNQLTNPDHLVEGQSLTIPPLGTLRLDVELLDGAKSGFRLTLRGGQPGEAVVFEIDAPDGSTYTGSPHVTSPEGVVTTTYNTVIGTGTYRVAAHGEQGTEAEISFHVAPGRG